MGVVLSSGLQSSKAVAIEMQEYTPGIFTTSGNGSDTGLILLGDTTDLASVLQARLKDRLNRERLLVLLLRDWVAALEQGRIC